MFIRQFSSIIDLVIRSLISENNAFLLIDPSFAFLIGCFCLKSCEMNIKDKKKDYLVYLLWLFGVIPSNILKNYLIVKSPTLRAQKVLYLIE